MAKRFFEPVKMSQESLLLVKEMVEITNTYMDQGLDLSLRQLYYRLVTNGAVTNEEKSYKRVGSTLGNARMNGYIDWDVIKDRGRQTEENSHWRSPSAIIKACARQFRYDVWEDQPWHVEVMIEKQALEGVILPTCEDWDVPFTANKGYSSLSALYETGQRLQKKLEDGKSVAILYLGDHDPSGIDMTRDVRDRGKLFSNFVFNEPDIERRGSEWHAEAMKTKNPRRFHLYGNAAYADQQFVVDRLALNMEQVEERDLFPNPTKMSDSRAGNYVAQYGDDSWELDALEPSELVDVVNEGIQKYVDQELYDDAVARQEEARDQIDELASEVE